MRVQCDVCGVEPAAVLCCADEAALCSPCNRRVHRANKLAGKHRRITLLQPSSDKDDAGPLCDVCKERRGVVFCVEDRAILCADCDEPIHSANELTAKHSRFLLVGTKLSAEPVDQEIPCPDGSADEHDDSSAAEVDTSAVLEVEASHGKGGAEVGHDSSSISDYLTNICPGWRVEDILLDDAAFAAATAAKQKGRDEQVPFLDADLFDVVSGGRPGKRGAAWAPHVPQTPAPPAWGFEEVPFTMVAPPTAKAKQGHVKDWYHSDSDSDVFAVPEISPPPPPAKRARPSSFWCL
ncbi:B-box zinc finger protein 20-like [Lolium rigidum]|uniref:B-box zinc finger protein 20-like n=1 Tax=Lolium rigidum TaxID=89674 RepID=UPI001F5C2660|nr:B-box zinc finger protein 20-like [Lolium rigidum]